MTKSFLKKQHFVQHQETHSEVRSFKCSICPEGRYFKTKYYLNQHMLYHYAPKFACSHCEYNTYRKNNLDRHLKTHKKINIFLISRYKLNTIFFKYA